MFEKPGGYRRRHTGRWLVTRNGGALWARTAQDENHKCKIRSDQDQGQNGGGVAVQDLGELKHSGALLFSKRAAARARTGACKVADFALEEHRVAYCDDVET